MVSTKLIAVFMSNPTTTAAIVTMKVMIKSMKWSVSVSVDGANTQERNKRLIAVLPQRRASIITARENLGRIARGRCRNLFSGAATGHPPSSEFVGEHRNEFIARPASQAHSFRLWRRAH